MEILRNLHKGPSLVSVLILSITKLMSVLDNSTAFFLQALLKDYDNQIHNIPTRKIWNLFLFLHSFVHHLKYYLITKSGR